MSTEAWGDYEVPGSPFFVLVDGRTGRRIGEGVANHFHQVADLVRRAEVDARPFALGSSSRALAEGLDGPAGSRPTTRSCWRRASSPVIRASIPPRSPTLYGPIGPTGRSGGGDGDRADHQGRLTVATLRAHGIEAPLPGGFEGRIFVRPSSGGGVPYPVAHFATFALPADVGDFGGEQSTDGPSTTSSPCSSSTGPRAWASALFARQGMPRSLTAADFRPYVLRRGLGGQSGTQWFFTEAGRPFTFYAVLGSHTRRAAWSRG